MPKLSQNEWYARKATKDISNMLDLPEAVVRSVIDALALHLLDELREKGMNADEAETVELELPNIGTLKLFPAKYPDNECAILNGRAFKPKFIIREQFLLKLRYAYYDHHNYILDEVTQNFKDMFDDHYKSIIRGDEDE